MSRYTGPRLRIMRALGTELPGLSRKPVGERDSPPGQHGARRGSRLSGFAVKLIEKQKLRFNYGLTERQLRNLFLEAKAGNGPAGDRLLVLLERRLDNAVFRAGFAPTGISARQLVRHRHVLLNGRRVNIPSIRVRPGDEISMVEAAYRFPLVAAALEGAVLARPEWLGFDEATRCARVNRHPQPDEVPFPVDVQHVVEFYSNRT